jgi:hypothetical protein
VRLVVDGTSCAALVRWSVDGQNNGNPGDLETLPWSMTRTATSGDSVSLKACNECTVTGDVSIRVSIYWRDTLLRTSTHSGHSDPSRCKPQSAIDLEIP